jgi:hypothetical protein
MTRFIDALRGPLAVAATATGLAFSSWPAVVLGLAWLAFYAVDKLLLVKQVQADKAAIDARFKEMDERLVRVLNKTGVRM